MSLGLAQDNKPSQPPTCDFGDGIPWGSPAGAPLGEVSQVIEFVAFGWILEITHNERRRAESLMSLCLSLWFCSF